MLRNIIKFMALVCFVGLAGILLLWSSGSISFQYLPNAAVQAANQAVTSGTNMVAQVTARRQACRCRSRVSVFRMVPRTLEEALVGSDVVASIEVEALAPARLDTPDGRPPANWDWLTCRKRPGPEDYREGQYDPDDVYTIYRSVQVRVERYFKGEALASQVEGPGRLTLTRWGGEMEGMCMEFPNEIAWEPGMRGVVFLRHSRTLGGPWSEGAFHEYDGGVVFNAFAPAYLHPDPNPPSVEEFEAQLEALAAAGSP